MKSIDLVIADVNFKLTVVEKDGERWVPIRPICEAIGVDHSAQRKRVDGDHRFNSGLINLESSNGEKETLCIPIRRLEAFLFTVNTRATTKPEVRKRLEIFQTMIADLIHRAFNNDILNNAAYAPLLQMIQELRAEVSELRESRAADQLIIQQLINRDNAVTEVIASSGGRMLHAARRPRISHLKVV